MSSRLNRLLGALSLSLVIMFSIKGAPGAYSLPVSEQVSQYSNEEEIVGTIYDKIVNGDAAINISNDSDLDIRANIDVSEVETYEETSRTFSSSLNEEGSNSKYELGQEIANFAQQLVGKPYVYGSTGPNSFDCSGLIVYVYSKFGINLPRTSQTQAYVGNRVSRGELMPGDLVFSNTYGTLSHVGIYIGNNRFVHAANSGTGVTISRVNDDYYGSRYAWSTRPYL